MQIAIYWRVSSEAQAKEDTIDSQLEALRECGKRHKLEIVDECLGNGNQWRSALHSAMAYAVFLIVVTAVVYAAIR